ncbi:X-linked interleukin-1 receptor accessory protein-like 2 isoform X2 [Palaemon carinicauda]|uniref:X-linked interleukin-1 receptor accessory protein-like 2 isoform X2 n=1 Tax=Palaemon carinicauda TaxID=392227 RepID=UPI0035B64C2E
MKTWKSRSGDTSFKDLVIVGTAKGDCPCKNVTKRIHHPLGDIASIGLSRYVSCCTFLSLGYDDPNAAVVWTFNGKPVEGMGKSKHLICDNQTIYIEKVEASDEGNYTCAITASNGTKGSITTSLEVSESSGFQEGPKDVTAPSQKCSWKGDPANLTCQGMVGKPGNGNRASIHWFIWVDGEPEFLPDDVIPITTKIDKDGIMRSSLVFKSVTSEHFKVYRCMVKNSYRAIERNISFIEGDPEYCTRVNVSKLSVLVIAPVACLLLAVLCLWWRFSTTLRIKCKERKHRKYARDTFLRDVFIVHGNQASSWVSSVLVSTLEENYGYTCYIPDRDMLGGEQYAEAISNEMRKCRRVLVVVTPCLLQSQWAFWSAHHGISTCFKSSSILGVVLQEFGNHAISSETTVLLKTLKPIETLKVPRALQGLVPLNEYKELPEKSRHSLFGDRLGENTSALVIESSLSPSPKNQRLSNMITGSNNSSREVLNERYDCQQEKKDLDPPVIYVEDTDNAVDPGSPCSITPFILPTCQTKDNGMQDSPPCYPFFNCMRAVFVGDPETVFWQKVRLFLDPPTLRRKLTIESTA